jgi:hypothetical protein
MSSSRAVGTTDVGPNSQDFGAASHPDRGAFNDGEAVLRAVDRSLAQAEAQLRPPVPAALAGWFELNEAVICESLTKLGSRCGTE